MYEVQTRALLNKLSAKLKRKATLADIPDTMLDEWNESGFEWIWLLGIWQTGQAGKKISQSRPEWLEEFRKSLPDLTEKDITGSCYAIKDYKVHADFGGEEALKTFRERLNERGMLLVLDFVPNHTAPDHRWVKQFPDYFIRGREDDLKAEPDNYLKIKTGKKEFIFAHGRDPNYPGWPDTLQLDFSNQRLQKAMKEELLSIASKCDGVRCDMAMLLLPDVFEKTWRRPIRPFWPGAIERVRDKYPDFLFLAEVYWDREWEMQQLGFDYCYDKRLYDRVLHPYAPAIRDHLRADTVFQDKLMRFIENHDEPRAATAFPGEMQKAAAVITYFSPGMKFFHHGQLEGYRTKIPVHLNRGPKEKMDKGVRTMYDQFLKLLKEPVFKSGNWRLLDCRRAGEEDDTYSNFLTYCWQDPGRSRFMVAVNYSPNPSRANVAMPFPELTGNTWKFTDQLSEEVYEHKGNELLSEGLYLELPGWGVHIFRVGEV
jgi:glycosidase